MQMLKVLIVDDDVVTRTLLIKRLRKAGYEVEGADSGVEAVRMISRCYYDAVLTDLMMPGGVDGIGVLESSKENDIRTEVIIITAHASIDNAILAMKKGAADYLQKPINFDELFLRLEKIQNLKHLMKSATDLRDAMQTTEQASSETIQNLEIAISELELRLSKVQSILARKDLSAEERIQKALGT